MQLWYHQRRSYLARGAAREQVAFFSPTQLSSGVHWFTSASASVQAVVNRRRTSGASSRSSRDLCPTREKPAGAGSHSTTRKCRYNQPHARNWTSTVTSALPPCQERRTEPARRVGPVPRGTQASTKMACARLEATSTGKALRSSP